MLSPPGQRPRLTGHCLVEGILVEAEHGVAAAAVRRATGEIIVRRRTIPPRRSLWARLLGLRTLTGLPLQLMRFATAFWFSAQQAGLVGHLVRAEVDTGRLPPPSRRALRTARLRVAWTLALGLIFGLCGLFCLLFLPLLLSAPQQARGSFEAIVKETGIGLVWPVAFFGAVGRLPPLSRVLGYHGALHRVLSAYHAGAKLDVRGVAAFSHHRGPCFLQVMALWAILMPWVTRLMALTSNSWRVGLLASGHTFRMGRTFGMRAAVGAVTLVVALAIYRRMLRAERFGFFGLWQVAASWVAIEPTPAMTEVALAAVQAAASGDGVDAGDRLRRRASDFSPLAGACTHGASRLGWARRKVEGKLGYR